MYIGRIEFQNWKNFKSTRAQLSRRVFLVGPNASGKSNLLDALRFLRDVARDGLRVHSKITPHSQAHLHAIFGRSSLAKSSN
ncbi:MAG: ATP-binding protein [bacterium]|nr:ATP-binding protein [bacterium]